MPQALAIILRKRLELSRQLDNSQRDTSDIENEISALDRAIEFMKTEQPSESKNTRDSH